MTTGTEPEPREANEQTIEQRLAALEQTRAQQDLIRELKGEMSKLEGRGFWREQGVAVVLALASSAISIWNAQSSRTAEQETLKANLEARRQQDQVNSEMQSRIESMKEGSDEHIESMRQGTERRRIDAEILKELTPTLLEAKDAKLHRAMAVAGALEQSIWDPIKTGLSLDETTEVAKDAKKIDAARWNQLKNRSISCDRVSIHTTEQLDSKADKDEARSMCLKVKTVTLGNNSAPPYQWPDGMGLSFDIGKTVNGKAVWCSCWFTQ